MRNRDKFVYDNGYGITTDIYLLEPNTTFEVINGYWEGKIIIENGKKYLFVVDTNKKYEMNEFTDYGLVIRKINKENVKEEDLDNFSV